jgi:sugar O-acyltransferase (sialic acid O-acetyltransferase NeuD family)
MKPLILFGTGKIAEVLLYFFRHHSDREVVACTVDAAFIPGVEWEGLPVVPFDAVRRLYPPEQYDMFVAVGYHDMNALRAKKCAEARALGYTLTSYIDAGPGVPRDIAHGDNCFVMNQAIIHPRVALGNNVFVWSGAMIGHHSTIGDNCWLTSCANISGVTTVGANCFFAVNSTVGHGVTLGDECFLGANALVTKCADRGAVFLVGNTAPFRLNSRQFLRMSDFSDI